MKVVKFMLNAPDWRSIPSAPEVQVRGIFVAVVVAPDQRRARLMLIDDGAKEGHDMRWLEIAKVTEHDASVEAIITVAEAT